MKGEQHAKAEKTTAAGKRKLRRMYNKMDAGTSPLYKQGRDFEYKVMTLFFAHGWHVMRRFGSFGVNFCPKCGRHASRVKNKCYKCGCPSIRASLDLTAYKNGVYAVITCKSSKRRATAYLDDSLWTNLVTYSIPYGALPVFAGTTTEGGVHLTNLVNLKELPTETFLKDPLTVWVSTLSPEQTYRHPTGKTTGAADPKAVSRMIKECWDVIDFANDVIGDENANERIRARWATIKVQMLNVINRALYGAGLSTPTDDLSQLMQDMGKTPEANEPADGKIEKEPEEKADKQTVGAERE